MKSLKAWINASPDRKRELPITIMILLVVAFGAVIVGVKVGIGYSFLFLGIVLLGAPLSMLFLIMFFMIIVALCDWWLDR